MKQKENTGSKTNDFIAHTSYEQRGRFNQSLIGDVDTAFPTQLRMHLSRQEHKRWRRSAKGNVPPWRKAGVGRTLGAVAVEARAGQCPGHVSCPLNIKSSGGSPALLSLSGLPLCPSPSPALESWESSGLPAHACTPFPAPWPLPTLQGLNMLYLQFCDPFWFPFF